ncbi:MAG: 2-dehydropantoate 2-reductase N-terminal domain-containing protein, partial [Balneolaceae bacterium]|nr:2-dehydropantoate 2-reductase N-terminal domain-containing protein [Balneolaceae bacterium]
MKKISIIGAGSFGTALAVVLGDKGFQVTVWAREADVTKGINKNRVNPEYLTDIELPEQVRATNSIEEALNDAEMVLFATPTHALREVAGKVKPFLTGNEFVVTVSKGIEKDSFMTPSQI